MLIKKTSTSIQQGICYSTTCQVVTINRFDITQLLLHLWHQANCRESIIQQAGTEKFSSFLGAIFDTLLYQLNDSLLRITNVHRLELEKDNSKLDIFVAICFFVSLAAVWSTLSVEEVNTKERFLLGEKRAVRSLLNMVKHKILPTI